MATENHDKFVYFDVYCKQCKYKESSESDDPCWDCLENATNINSHKPTEFVEAMSTTSATR